MTNNKENLTLVSCYYDLKSIDKIERRSPDDYFEYVLKLLELNVNLVIFIEPKFYDKLLKMCNNKVKVIPLEFEELYGYQYIDNIKLNLGHNPILNRNDNKDTYNYIALIWSKLDLVMKVIEDNPYKSTHFGWIDFGLFHTAVPPNNDLFNDVPNKIKLMMIDNIKVDENYFSTIKPCCACGLITGRHDNLTLLNEQFNKTITSYLIQGYVSTEEMYFPIIIDKHPDLFDFYYGCYDAILINYNHHVLSLSKIIECLKNSFQLKNYFITYDIGNKLINDWTDSYLYIKDDELFRIFIHYVLGAYYLGKETVKDISLQFKRLIDTKETFKNLYLLNKTYIDNIFKLLTI